ncbi:hypothetical protein [Streptomyces beigongshangae]|uniref:hypothetical protein n=1 Tax=Streptomyces beigongshangae TaxID=2841597 RepID=UPI0027DFFF89|nr:hypothetical protein [Streptomyces sp. REN17]
MNAPMDAEQAWNDLQRIRVPQERVYDEVERSATDGRGSLRATALLMWVFLVCLGLDPAGWDLGLLCAGYAVLLGALAALHDRRSRVRLHRTRYPRRTAAAFAAGAVLTGGTALVSGRLVEPLAPMTGSLVQATVSAAVFLLFAGPANRWAAGAVRERGAQAPGARAADAEAGR